MKKAIQNGKFLIAIVIFILMLKGMCYSYFGDGVRNGAKYSHYVMADSANEEKSWLPL